MSLAVVNAIPDYHQDLLVGKRNLVVRLGRAGGVVLYLALAAAALAVAAAGALAGLFPVGVPRRAPRAPAARRKRAARARHVHDAAPVRPGDPQHRRLLRRGGDAVHRSACSCTGCDDASHRHASARRSSCPGSSRATATWRASTAAPTRRRASGCPTSSTPTKRCSSPTTSRAAACRTSCCAAASRSSCPTSSRVAEALGRAGVKLKIETNGQRLDAAIAARLARLPIRSIQVSLDGDTQEVYGRQRAGASLAKAHDACRAVREAGLPLEITFAPTRLNIHEAEAVIARAREFGAFRFNSGKLMRLGTAARHWSKLAPSEAQYREFRDALARAARILEPPLELCYVPWSVEDGLRAALGGTAGDVAGASERLGQGGGGASRHLRRPAAREHRAGLAGVPGGLAQRSNESSSCGARSTTSRRHAQANDWQWTPLVHV